MTRLTDAEFNAQPHIDHCDCTREHADDRCVAYRAILAEGNVHDYDSTERPIGDFRTHLWAQHGVNEEALHADELAVAHAAAHRRESGIGDREPTVGEVTAVVMKLIDETINDREYVNSRGEPMPWNVMDFSTLHEYTDANMYLIEAEAHFGAGWWDFADGDETGFQKAVGHANEVTDAVTLILTDRVDNVQPVMTWKTDDCSARILNPAWLTEMPFILNWTDHMTQEESFRFETLSEAVACLAALIRCGEDAWRSGFNLGNEEMADAIVDFFGKAIS